MVAGVPQRFPISLNGRQYLVETKRKQYGRSSIPLRREQFDTSPVVGEGSLSTEDLWPRSVESWHRGSGQDVYDRADADPFRFDDSLGVNPWEKWELSLLGETENKLSSTEDNVQVVAVGSRLYASDGPTLKYTTDITGSGVATWTTVTGTPTADIEDMTTDGFNLWVAFGAEGIYKTDTTSGSASIYNVLEATHLDFVKGRLMAANNNSVYNVTAASDSVSFRERSFASNTGGTVDIAYPNGTKENDILILVAAVADFAFLDGENITAPNDWTFLTNVLDFGDVLVGDGVMLYVWYKVAGGSGGSARLTWVPPAVRLRAAMAAYDKGYEVEPINNDIDGTATSSSTTVNAPAITTTHAKMMSVFGGMVAANTTFTPPTGFTERTDTTSGSLAVTLADKEQTNAGDTGAISATAGSAANNAAIHLAIRPEIPDALLTHSNTNFEWVGFAEGLGDIYMAGFSGDKSIIYKTQVKPDGTALDVPVVAGSLPDGEIVRSIYGYLGFIFVGTDQGLRMARSDADGNLEFGALIETDEPVRCFEGQKNFVWYGLESFDVSRWESGTYDGLGRLDLTQEILPNTPAYASDLMVTGSTSTTEQVLSIATFQELRVFTIADSGELLSRGVYVEKSEKVATGYIDSGLVTYNIPDTKVATYVDLRHNPLTGEVEVFTSADQGSFTSRGSSTTANSTAPSAFSAGPSRGETHELRMKLDRASSTDTTGPVVTRIRLRSEPAPTRGEMFQVPILLYEELVDLNGQTHTLDPASELDTLFNLFDTQTLVTYEDRGASKSVFVRDIEFEAESPTQDGTFWQGVVTMTLKAPGS